MSPAHPPSDLTGRPVKLDEFAAYFSKYQDVIENKEKYEQDHAMINTMYDMLTEYGGKVPPSDQVRLLGFMGFTVRYQI